MLKADRSKPYDERMNVVVVVSDTLRTAFLGCYGNQWINTPNIDAFAADGVLFENAHPEALPTIPVRRSMHSGRRVFPFATYEPLPWDNVYIPGWQPMDRDETTIAETLVSAGYHTGFYADVPHYFVPGMNFTRGFLQWEFVRGQAEDRYRSSARTDERLIDRYTPVAAARAPFHLANVHPSGPEEEWPTARTFRSAIRFLQENRDNEPFYLYVDTFSPHETWEAPLHYYELYGNLDDREPIPIGMPYAPISEHPEVEAYLPSLKANYAGLVSMVDHWFGELLSTLDTLKLRDSTVVVFASDHGTNFGDNAEGVTGKPEKYLYPGTMDVPLIVRKPGGETGVRRNELVYLTDIQATIMSVADQSGAIELDGRDLAPLVRGSGNWSARDYLTCRYGNHVWYKDGEIYFYSDVGFSEPRLYDRGTDPECSINIASTAKDLVNRARDAILHDAGGQLVNYVRRDMTDAIGRPVFDPTETD